ncbi:MAG: cupin domain-containing protein [Chitinispirillaceae bacterium]|nr:cupin domain-containing protein [Chitinispirillaceae bacterium]
MKVIHFADAERCEPDPGWRRASLCAEPGISIEHFVKPAFHSSPLHRHPSAQVLVVLQGSLAVKNGSGDEAVIEAGGAVYLPGDEPHLVVNPLDRPSIGLDIFIPGRSFDFWRERGKRP